MTTLRMVAFKAATGVQWPLFPEVPVAHASTRKDWLDAMLTALRAGEEGRALALLAQRSRKARRQALNDVVRDEWVEEKVPLLRLFVTGVLSDMGPNATEGSKKTLLRWCLARTMERGCGRASALLIGLGARPVEDPGLPLAPSRHCSTEIPLSLALQNGHGPMVQGLLEDGVCCDDREFDMGRLLRRFEKLSTPPPMVPELLVLIEQRRLTRRLALAALSPGRRIRL